MSEREGDLRRALREQRVPDEHEAERRTWRVVAAAAAEERPAAVRRGRLRRQALQGAVAVGLIALLASPAGASVRTWIAERIAPGVEHAQPVLGSLPGSGSLLVQSSQGPWIVRPDGGKRLLGSFSEASWSPHGLFVVAGSRRELTAVGPDGTVRWSLARRGPVRLPRWNGPDGYRIAYLDGGSVRVVDGNGTDDRPIARGVASVAPAWKSGPAHVLAYVEASGAIRAISADTRIPVLSTGPGPVPISLQWVGGRLLVARPGGLRLLDAEGRTIWHWTAPAGGRVRSAAASRSGRTIAVVVRRGPTSRLLRLTPGRPPRVVFAGPGNFGKPVWSPDGRRLLLPWPSADQWLFVSPERSAGQLHAVGNIAAQFAPGATSRARFPEVAGWCCTP